MQMQSNVVVHAVKESAGEFEGRAFSSTTFHCEVDLKENSAGRSIGRVTRPFKLGDAKEFDKWLPFAHQITQGGIPAVATFDMEAAKEGPGGSGVKLTLVAIRPAQEAKKAA